MVSLLPLAQGLLGFLVDGALTGDFPFIVNLAALRKGEFALQTSIFKVHAQRHQCQTTFGGAADKTIDFGSPEQKLPCPERIVVRIIAVRVRADVTIEQPDLTGFAKAVGILQIDLS